MTDRFSSLSGLFSPVKWSDLQVGLERGWIDSITAVMFAGDYWIDHPSDETDALRELASASPGERDTIIRAATMLARNETLGHERALRRWRYVFLWEAAHQAKSNGALFTAVERVYADFDYPEDMGHLVYYMPAPPGSAKRKASREDLERELADDIYSFLRQEYQELCSQGSV